MKILILAASALLASNAAHASEAQNFVCGGTEPFYSLTISGSKGLMTYSGPENLKGTSYAIKAPIHAAGLVSGTVSVIQGKKSPVSATLISNVMAGNCSDGMSDHEYAYHLVYKNGDEVLYGCCDLAN